MKMLAGNGLSDEAEIDSVDFLICTYESLMRMRDQLSEKGSAHDHLAPSEASPFSRFPYR
jgi:hypothetical protein